MPPPATIPPRGRSAGPRSESLGIFDAAGGAAEAPDSVWQAFGRGLCGRAQPMASIAVTTPSPGIPQQRQGGGGDESGGYPVYIETRWAGEVCPARAATVAEQSSPLPERRAADKFRQDVQYCTAPGGTARRMASIRVKYAKWRRSSWLPHFKFTHQNSVVSRVFANIYIRRIQHSTPSRRRGAQHQTVKHPSAASRGGTGKCWLHFRDSASGRRHFCPRLVATDPSG